MAASGQPSNQATRARVADRQELANELRKRVSGEVRFDPFSRYLYSTDASMYQMDPVGVVVPRNVEDVLAVMEVASQHKTPVLPRCGGTSLAGQTVNHAIVMDFTKYMSRVIALNEEEGWARVEPGIVLDELNRIAAPFGLKYAPDPTTSNRACVGGGIGNNTCGSHSVVYGKTIDHIMELRTILSDGSQAHFRPLDQGELESKLSGDSLESSLYRDVLRIGRENRDEVLARYPQIMRRVSGYNLDDFIDPGAQVNMSRMIVGSEGTLCVVTEAKVNLVPVPHHKGLAVVHFYDVVEACDATWEILRHNPAAVEMIGRMILDRCRESLGSARLMDFVEGAPDALLVVELTGESEEEVVSKLSDLRSDMARKGLGYTCLNILEPSEQAKVWALRSSGLGLLMSARGDSKPLAYVEDTAVDPQKLGAFIKRFDEIVKAHDTEAAYYGHASVGCLHVRPLVNLKTSDGTDKMVSLASEISDLTLEFGGSLSGEHGDGIVRGVWNEKMFGSQLYQAFREVKQAFDPHNIMNPGKIVDCPPMTENLRISPSYKAVQPETTLDFSKDFGYAAAAEMCNGMGACRKATGTMCPSYMVTREEEHSTRGRANLLRGVLSGALPQHGLDSKRLYEAMDLCLECKGCKAECQTGVDMAKMKYEFLDHYNRSHGISLRTRAFANINTLSRLGSRIAPLVNLASGFPLSRLILSKLMGVHPNRSLPRLASKTFPAWAKSRRPNTDGRNGSVVLFNDTFMDYNYPGVGMAAVEILEAAGFNVIPANPVCCGRPMISKGLLSKAKDNARRNVDLLYPYARDGIPIVGCEPSCLLTLKDECPDLLTDDKADAVAANSFLIDDFLAGLKSEGRLELDFGDLSKKVLFHGHCHQKALTGTANAMAALRLAPGYEVQEVNSGCCGMAGSFGYEKEHYDVSMAVGRQTLFPAVESKGPDWEVAVMGVSCRQQIEHATGRRARHLVEVLRDALPR